MIYKRKIILEPIDIDLETLIDIAAKPIIKFNKEHHWEDDNFNDIISELINNYEFSDKLSDIINKVENYLYKNGY